MVRKRRYELSLEDGSPTEAEVPSVFPELDTRTKKHLKEVVLSLVFAFAVMLVAYLQRDWMSFYQREAVEQLVIRRGSRANKPFSYIKTSSSFWTWSETHLMEALYDGGNAYDNSLQRNSLYKVQWTKFRQERVSQDAPFTIPNDVLSSTFGHCKEPFSSYNKDWRDYGVGWTPKKDTGQNVTDPGLSAWIHRTAEELREVSFHGIHGVYYGGGYQVELGKNRTESVAILRTLRDNNWIDEKTRAVFVQLTLYNPNSNLMTTVLLSVEFSVIGAAFPTHEVLIFPPYFGFADLPISFLVSEIFLLLLSGYLVYVEGWRMYKMSFQYFKHFWHILDSIIIAQAFGTFGVFFYTQYVADVIYHQMDAVEEEGAWGSFVNYRKVAIWSQTYTYTLGILISLTTVKLLHLLGYIINGVTFLSATMLEAAAPLSGFSVIFLISVAAFAQMVYLVVGNHLFTYSTFVGTLQEMLNWMLGDFDYDQVTDVSPHLGPVMVFLFNISFQFFLMMVFATVLCEALALIRVKAEEDPRGDDLPPTLQTIIMEGTKSLRMRHHQAKAVRKCKDVVVYEFETKDATGIELLCFEQSFEFDGRNGSDVASG
ncbi:polycystin-1-like protein 2 isoform X2 [Branchiostoma lanceolatum]|uniref:polycystin-1-like protein 2 isoform X2 n=1 Tax=Branchiostoma lanceolatum TaxID=7740 RepID=UPI0034533DA8